LYYSVREDKLCQVWNGSFVTVTGSISEDEIRFTRDISSLKPKDMSTRKKVPVVAVTLMKLGITEVRDRRLPFDSWGVGFDVGRRNICKKLGEIL
jgi:hypothetical protein